jgi:hypothetical protein
MSERVLVRARFDPASETSVAVAVAETLAVLSDAVVDLPPLAHSVDTDAVDALFAPRFGAVPPTGIRLTFPYQDWEVTVFGSGDIVVAQRRDPELPYG